jgi:hypothetical protein
MVATGLTPFLKQKIRGLHAPPAKPSRNTKLEKPGLARLAWTGDAVAYARSANTRARLPPRNWSRSGGVRKPQCLRT